MNTEDFMKYHILVLTRLKEVCEKHGHYFRILNGESTLRCKSNYVQIEKEIYLVWNTGNKMGWRFHQYTK